MKLHTKSDFTALMHRFLDPLLPLYSEGGARLHLGDTGVTYPGRTIEMEAFSPPLWALAPFWTGGGRADDFLRIYRKGLASGTDPESPEYWGDPNDYDQLFVEMAALACAILETPESVWEPLTDAEKANLAKWLDTINHHDLPGCNWLLFRVLVNLQRIDVARRKRIPRNGAQQVRRGTGNGIESLVPRLQIRHGG